MAVNLYGTELVTSRLLPQLRTSSPNGARIVARAPPRSTRTLLNTPGQCGAITNTPEHSRTITRAPMRRSMARPQELLLRLPEGCGHDQMRSDAISQLHHHSASPDEPRAAALSLVRQRPFYFGLDTSKR